MKQIFNLYKKAYSHLPINIWLLSFVMLINRSGTMVIAFLTLYCTQHLKFTTKDAGIIIAFYGLGSIAGAFIGGKLTDKLGYKKIQLASLIGGGILFIITPLSHTFNSVAACIFTLAAVNESFRPANTAAVAANCTPENRTRSFALIRLAMNLGWSIGATLGGIIAHFNYPALFWVDGSTNILSGIALFFLIKQKVNNISTNTKNKEATLGKQASPFSNKPFMYFIFSTLLFTFCFFQLFSNIPMFYKQGLHLSEFVIGIVMALNGIIIALFEMLVVHSIEHKFNKQKLIVTGTLGVMLFFVLCSITNFLPALFIAFGGICLVTFAEMLSLPFMNSYYLNYANNTNTGKYAAVYMACWSIGQIAAGVVGGYLIEHFGFSILWLCCAILAGISAALYFKVIKE